ncbi:MAG: polysulfide reductase NrfD [Actinomycetota bacterium]|nr:polysulfide reductase NrfD [Actinomycetota bacterium]
MTSAAGANGYYGRPVLKKPVWKPYIALYFFTGGLAGASSTLALGARLAGYPRLARSAMLTSLAGVAVSGPLLVVDLGRPGRFANMLRVAKPTSPMSVGSWILAAFAPVSAMAAGSEVTGLLPTVGAAAGTLAGLLGSAVATYTAVLVTDTAIPAWHGASRELPFLFAGSAATSAAGVALALTPVDDAGPARRLAALGAAAELGAFRAMERALGDAAGPYRDGGAGRLKRAAEACTAAGGILALAGARHRRSVAVAAGALLATGSVLTRFSVYRAGFESAEDPSATIGPQRRRVDAGAAPA